MTEKGSPSEASAPFSRFFRRWGVPLVWGLVVACCLGLAKFYDTPVLSLFHRAVSWVETNPLGPLAYVAIFLARPLVLLPASVVSIAAGYCFGVAWGMVWVTIASGLAALMGYGLGRWCGMKGDPSETNWLGKAAGLLRRQGAFSVMLLRWCFFPYEPVSYLCGALKLPLGAFLLGNFVGNLPGTTACVLAGAAVEHPWTEGMPQMDPRLQLAALGCLSIMILLATLVKRRLAGTPAEGVSAEGANASA